MIPILKTMDWTPEYFIANRSSCNAMLNDICVLKEIPVLNNGPLHDFKDRELVRFRGMVQDMYDPEYYFRQYAVKNMQTGVLEIRTGLYADSVRCLPHEEILFNSRLNINAERQTCFVISTPGLNQWVKEKYERVPSLDTNLKGRGNYKRSLDEEEMDCSEPHQKKEKVSSEKEDHEMADDSDKKQQTIVSKEHILNFPIPIEDGKACIVKIYKETPLKLNQVVDIIGFISLDPSLSGFHDSEDTMTEAEINTHHPPASLVPRLHAVKINHLTTHEIQNAPEIISKAQSIRSDLHLVLSQLLFGDHLAADYLICHLLSSIYMRRDYFCLGAFPLNITHFPIEKYKLFSKDFYNFLTIILKKSHLLDVTLENLNDLSLLPKKDYECNRLTSGVLQLSDHTHLVLDETELSSGQVSQAGRENYNAICHLINFQKVSYDFKYYKMEYEMDIPILILSEAKSFFPCPTQVVIQTDLEAENVYPQVIEIVNQYLKDKDRLSNIRQYLEVLRHTKFEFNEEIVKVIQADFIQMRQDNKNMSVDNLHLLMVLARLMSLSYGSNTLTTEYWKKAVEMEAQRTHRLSQQKKV